MPHYVVDRTVPALNDRARPSRGAEDPGPRAGVQEGRRRRPREPAFELIELLEHLGAEVDYHDPHVPADAQDAAPRPADEEHRADRPRRWRGTTASWSRRTTRRTTGRWSRQNAKLLVDTRGVTRNLAGPKTNVVQA